MPFRNMVVNDLKDEFIAWFNEHNYSEFVLNFKLYAARFGAVKIFKFLHSIDDSCDACTMKLAIKGGNCEIIHIIESTGYKFSKVDLVSAILYYNEDMIRYIIRKLDFSDEDIKNTLKETLADAGWLSEVEEFAEEQDDKIIEEASNIFASWMF